MDLTGLMSRIARGHGENAILSLERGNLVRRTHVTVGEDVQAACASLRGWGVRAGMRVGIRAPNCYQWIVYDLALIQLRAVSVAFTEDFDAASAAELCRRYQLSLLLISSADASRVGSDTGAVACIDRPDVAARVEDVEHLAPDEEFVRPALAFSSGSSGGVKGIVLNRRGIEANVSAFVRAVGPRKDDRLLLFLPMSNFQQRLMYYAALWYGFDLIVTDVQGLFRALKELHPTMLIAPPALYENFESRFYSLPKWKVSAAHCIADLIAWLPFPAMRHGLARIAFRQAHAPLGGRMRFMVTGMAPVKRSTLRLFERMQLPLFETYGLLECGSISLNVPGACRVGSVGKLLPGAAVKLAQDGEIIARRDPPLALRYFECAAGESERTFISGNWVATGDIGRLDEDGYLYILGRKKEIIITSGGVKVHPELLEAEIDGCPDVMKSVVFRVRDDERCVILVVPRDPSDITARNRIKQFVDDVRERCHTLASADLVFTHLVFSRENGFLRPNLKLNRPNIVAHFGSRSRTELEAAAGTACR